jgi:MFS family permease
MHLPDKKPYRFILLFFLYLSQGIPFGFQATALPLMLRERNVSLALIGMSTMLASPWMLKFLWAPLIDMKWNRSIGRRRTWIIPLQAILIIAILSASRTIAVSIYLLAVNILVMNIAAATQDVAVDGLAVDVLRENELGYGNSAQVVGYKAGMIISGGLLVWLSGYFGWGIQFIVMAVIASIPLILILFYKEKEIQAIHYKEKLKFSEVIIMLTSSFKHKSARYFILFILLYKSGEVMIDIMFKPFVIDSGFSASSTGLWIGTYGMAASICGSLAGGILSSRKKPLTGLLYAAIFRLIPLACITAISLIKPQAYHIIVISLLEHFFGGMLTTAVFAFMMFNVDRIIGATHYTLFASIEVIGKSPGAALSGIVAQRFGYSVCFVTGTIISALVILLLPLYKRSRAEEQ